MLEPYQRLIYDPTCGSGGMFVQSHRFIKAHNENLSNISIYGQELNDSTCRFCKMNLAIKGMYGNISGGHYTPIDDLFKDLKADYIITNPPFNMTLWGADKVAGDVRWKYGTPDDTSKNGGNFAWIQHYIYYLAPNGIAGFVMANGAM